MVKKFDPEMAVIKEKLAAHREALMKSPGTLTIMGGRRSGKSALTIEKIRELSKVLDEEDRKKLVGEVTGTKLMDVLMSDEYAEVPEQTFKVRVVERIQTVSEDLGSW